MPVHRHGRYVETIPDELNAWLGKESGKPVHVATETTDLAAELKRGRSFVRSEKQRSHSLGSDALARIAVYQEKAFFFLSHRAAMTSKRSTMELKKGSLFSSEHGRP